MLGSHRAGLSLAFVEELPKGPKDPGHPKALLRLLHKHVLGGWVPSQPGLDPLHLFHSCLGRETS